MSSLPGLLLLSKAFTISRTSLGVIGLKSMDFEFVSFKKDLKFVFEQGKFLTILVPTVLKYLLNSLVISCLFSNMHSPTCIDSIVFTLIQ